MFGEKPYLLITLFQVVTDVVGSDSNQVSLPILGLFGTDLPTIFCDWK